MNAKACKILTVAALIIITLIVIFIFFDNMKKVEIQLEEMKSYYDEGVDVCIVNSMKNKLCGEIGLDKYFNDIENGSIVVSKRKIDRVVRKSTFSQFVTVYVSGEKSANTVYIYTIPGEKIYFDDRCSIESQIVVVPKN